MWKKLRPYVGFTAIALAAGGISNLLAGSSQEKYDYLIKPLLAPPGWVFPVAWGIIYVLAGISAGLIWKKSHGRQRKNALWLWGLQLFVNSLWTFIFFRLEARLFAFIWLILLLGLVIAMVSRFGRISKTAAWLNAPYILWLCFAAYLNMAMYLFNG